MQKLESGFFGFWVRKYKVSFLLLFLIIFSGIFSLLSLPKESSPDIKFGIISIITSYPGVNPGDIDSLITQKVENKIKNIEGIKKITSRSSIGVSSTTIEFENYINVKDALNDVKTAIDKANLPNDANEPFISEISTRNELMFELLLYGDEKKFSNFYLKQLANKIKYSLESKIPGLSDINLSGVDLRSNLETEYKDYEIQILLDKKIIENLELSLQNISQTIKSYNKNTPIGNFSIGNLNYDFRFDGELYSLEELKNLAIKKTNSSTIYLKDIAKINIKYPNEKIQKLGFKQNSGFNYVSLAFNKNPGVNIFNTSKIAKQKIEEFLGNNPSFKDLGVFYVNDLSSIIIEDYSNLSKTAIQTFFLVFLTILFFIGFRESIIASILLPISFLITFIVLDYLGLSLNFLTNFSLILTLGIAIDTVIVIIEAASEKMNLGYNKNSAILLAVKDFKAPLISGTATTLVAFLPMMFLPGVMGKFLAYIPITVFSTLLAALILSLTISSALFTKLVKNLKFYHKDTNLEESFSKEQKELLDSERVGKIIKKSTSFSFREKIIFSLGDRYYNLLKKVLLNKKARILFIVSPIILLVASFVFLSPRIGFTLFPETDNGVLNIVIEGQKGSKKEFLKKYIPFINSTISKYDELKVYSISISGNKIDLNIELKDKNIRKSLGEKNVFQIEKEITKTFELLEKSGLKVSIKSLSNGPPAGKVVGIKLIGDSGSKIEELKSTSERFKEFLTKLKGTKNVSTSSEDSPGQFVFYFNEKKLSKLGINPDDILNELYFYTNGIKAGTIKSEFEENDMIIKIEDFQQELSPNQIENLQINTKVGKIKVGDIVDYKFLKGVSSISREDGRISIKVESDVEFGFLPNKIQSSLDDFAYNYIFPQGVSYIKGGETQENSELIISTFKSLFISLFLIFSILVLQFNSFSQPAIVLYSVILALLGVNLGLFITKNPYSMTFMIGFIALTGIVVNDAIILIDKINKNRERQVDFLLSILTAGKSRLQAIIVTSLTTIFGILPLALQDEFWAGLGFTIIFGLLSGSSMTLFVIPCLYYSFFKIKK